MSSLFKFWFHWKRWKAFCIVCEWTKSSAWVVEIQSIASRSFWRCNLCSVFSSLKVLLKMFFNKDEYILKLILCSTWFMFFQSFWRMLFNFDEIAFVILLFRRIYSCFKEIKLLWNLSTSFFKKRNLLFFN